MVRMYFAVMKRVVFTYFISSLALLLQGQIYSTNEANVKFTSEAPLEIIKAESDHLKGALDLTNKTFAFKLYIKSFDGFNSPLQKVHFYENYLEVKTHPESIFKGKILENIDLQSSKTYRAKGVLNIHGISKEVIIDVYLEPKKEGFLFSAQFDAQLKDYKIDLPRIVYQKIAEIINVAVSGELISKG